VFLPNLKFHTENTGLQGAKMNPIAERHVKNAVKALGILANIPMVRHVLRGQELFNLSDFLKNTPIEENKEILLLEETEEVILSAVINPNGEESPEAAAKFRELGYNVKIIERDEIGPVSIRIKIPKENWYVQLNC